MSDILRTPPDQKMSKLKHSFLHDSDFSNRKYKAEYAKIRKSKRLDRLETVFNSKIKSKELFVNFNQDVEEFEEAESDLAISLRYTLKALNFDDSENMVARYPVLYNKEMSFQYMKYNLIEGFESRPVYAVWHRHDQHRYIVKVGDRSEDSVSLSLSSKILFDEIQILKMTFEHPHIISCLNSWITNDRLYVQYELAAGGTLLDFLAGNAKEAVCASEFTTSSYQNCLLEPNSERLLVNIASALAYLKLLRISHNDIRPSNILVGFTLESDSDYSKTDTHTLLKSKSSSDVLRFILSNFTRSSCHKQSLNGSDKPSQYSPGNIQSYETDMFDLGFVLLQATSGNATDALKLNVQCGKRIRWPKGTSNRWRSLIGKLLDLEPETRMTAAGVLDRAHLRHLLLPAAAWLCYN